LFVKVVSLLSRCPSLTLTLPLLPPVYINLSSPASFSFQPLYLCHRFECHWVALLLQRLASCFHMRNDFLFFCRFCFCFCLSFYLDWIYIVSVSRFQVFYRRRGGLFIICLTVGCPWLILDVGISLLYALQSLPLLMQSKWPPPLLLSVFLSLLSSQKYHLRVSGSIRMQMTQMYQHILGAICCPSS
ncbi:Hypothetical predicted protein, partial [Drosophila guanche]